MTELSKPEGAARSTARIVLLAIAFRAVSAILAFFAVLAFPLDQPSSVTMLGHPNALADPFVRYDAGWYYQIAKSGYLFVPGGPSVGVGKPGKIAYFPVYPLVMRYTSGLFGRSPAAPYLAGIAVSWTAFVLAMIVVARLARLDLSEEQAGRAALLTAIFPFGFFFGMVYTEALFLLLTASSVLAFRERRWLAGGVAGGLATATRVNGILMLPALAWIAWRAAVDRRDRAMSAAGLLLVPAGIAAYSLYVYRLSGNPFEWAASITRWGYHPGGPPWIAPWHLVRHLTTHPYAYLTSDRMALYDTLYGVTGIVFAAATPFVWWRLGTAYGLIMIANVWLPLSSGVFEGMGRYCSVLFPFFIWLASFRSRAVTAALVVAFALVYAFALSLFATNHPIF